MTDARTPQPRVVVVGGGLSGSLLVQAIRRARAAYDVVVLDREADPLRSRSWADFERRTSSPGVARRFARMRIIGPSVDLVATLTEHTYGVWDGDLLERDTTVALEQLGGHRVTCSAASTQSGASSASVVTDAGPISATMVLDSVGLAPMEPGDPLGWLHFVGWRVTTDEPLFDSGTVTLMDFRVPQHGEARFVYTLPTDARSALVELTSFSPEAEPRAMAADLRQHLDRAVGAGCWTVVADESGSLPLRLPRRRRHQGRQLTIGGVAGLVKASTGYGVRLMQRDAEVVASELASGRPVRGLRRRRRHAWMDAVFLELATSQPGQLVRALELLFARNDIERVVRFLQEESTLVDECRIVASLPPAPFLRAALRTATRRRRTREARPGTVALP